MLLASARQPGLPARHGEIASLRDRFRRAPPSLHIPEGVPRLTQLDSWLQAFVSAALRVTAYGRLRSLRLPNHQHRRSHRGPCRVIVHDVTAGIE